VSTTPPGEGAPPGQAVVPAVPPPPRRRGSVFGALSRRVRTLILAAVLFIALFIVAMTLPVPYIVLSPGETCDTLGTCQNEVVVTLIGRKPTPTNGSLYLTTVNYSVNKLTVFDALSAWLNSEEVVVPRSALFPPGQTTQQVNRQNTADFEESQDSATIAAECELGYPKVFGVVSVTKGGASDGKLQPGDEFVSVDGQPATTYAMLKSILRGQQPGTSVPVVVKREGAQTSIPITLAKPVSGPGGSLGISVNTPGTCLAPFDVKLGLADQIGGPSAGLMFALGIMDKAGTDVTHGRVIAGTGTIDPDGTVGPIGGIQLKMIGAKRAGATIFLAPAGNCSDVKGAIPSGLQVIKVDTLHHAVQDLQASHEGKPVPHC
jgi:Lon-like protease